MTAKATWDIAPKEGHSGSRQGRPRFEPGPALTSARKNMFVDAVFGANYAEVENSSLKQRFASEGFERFKYFDFHSFFSTSSIACSRFVRSRAHKSARKLCNGWNILHLCSALVSSTCSEDDGKLPYQSGASWDAGLLWRLKRHKTKR